MNVYDDIINQMIGVDTQAQIKKNEDMKLHTTFRIGGPADLYVKPSQPEGLLNALRLCRDNNTEHVVIGCGSNLLVADEGFRGVVIDTTGISGICMQDDGTISAECGASLTKLAVFARDNGLSGLEFAYGIPGSVGGAVYMNAGAYGGEISDVCIRTWCCSKDAQLFALSREEHAFAYRDSVFQKNGAVILKSLFKLSRKPQEEITARMEENFKARRDKQPLDLPSAGSAFKRPKNAYAAALIDECGLKGKRIGAAQISEKHAGFIVNLGGATAADVKNLMETVISEVYIKTGITLTPEIKAVG